MDSAALAAAVLRGETRAAARACRAVDDEVVGHLELLDLLYSARRSAWQLGVTGSPGVGKSSLTDRLVGGLRQAGQRVAVVAIDPSSPFSGGAVLGDRVRMQRHFEDPEVFIRSVATRGSLGGLAKSCLAMTVVLEAWGANTVVIETVGVGQSEIEIAGQADTTLVVMAPGLGDEVQTSKAGLLECADVFAVNKADRPGADVLVAQLQSMIALVPATAAAEQRVPGTHRAALAPVPDHGRATASEVWAAPVVRCSALSGQGLDELLEVLARHRSWVSETEAGKSARQRLQRRRLQAFMTDVVQREVAKKLQARLEQAARQVEEQHCSPFAVGEALRREIENLQLL